MEEAFENSPGIFAGWVFSLSSDKRQAFTLTKYSPPVSLHTERKARQVFGKYEHGGLMKNVIAIVHGLFVCPCSHNK